MKTLESEKLHEGYYSVKSVSLGNPHTKM